MLYHIPACCNMFVLADVIANGRWNSHYRVVVEYQMVDVITITYHHGEHGVHDHKQQERIETTTPVSETITPISAKSDMQKAKWVINITSKPLTPVRESLLSHGPNFAVVPRGPNSGMCQSG